VHVITLSDTHTHTLERGSARCTDLYLTTKQSHETDVHAKAGFEPAIIVSERPQTHDLESAAIGTG
jgi:hypothetical protein